jgi:hypothetical protein
MWQTAKMASYRRDSTPSENIAIKRALEPNVKEEAKERMIGAQASPAKLPDQAKSNAAKLRALARIPQSREDIHRDAPVRRSRCLWQHQFRKQAERLHGNCG